MKIAVVTDDHRTISAHFGRAIYYEVFTISDGKMTGRETLPKPPITSLPMNLTMSQVLHTGRDLRKKTGIPAC